MRSPRLEKRPFTLKQQIEATARTSELPRACIKQVGQELSLMAGYLARIGIQVSVLRRVQALMLEVGGVRDAAANTKTTFTNELVDDRQSAV